MIELTVSVLAEKLELKKALVIHFSAHSLAAILSNNPHVGDWTAMAKDAANASQALVDELSDRGILQ